MPECEQCWWVFEISAFLKIIIVFTSTTKAKKSLLYTNDMFDSTTDVNDLLMFFFILSFAEPLYQKKTFANHSQNTISKWKLLNSFREYFFLYLNPPLHHHECWLVHQIDSIQEWLKKLFNLNLRFCQNLQQGSQDGPPPTQFSGWSRLGFDENAQLSALRFKSPTRQFFQIEHLGWVGKRTKTTKPIC